MSTHIGTIVQSMADNEPLEIHSFAGPGLNRATPKDELHIKCVVIHLGNTGYSIQLNGEEILNLIKILTDRLAGNYEVEPLEEEDLIPPFKQTKRNINWFDNSEKPDPGRMIRVKLVNAFGSESEQSAIYMGGGKFISMDPSSPNNKGEDLSSKVKEWRYLHHIE